MMEKTAVDPPPFRRGRLIRLGSANTVARTLALHRERTRHLEASEAEVIELGRLLAERIVGSLLAEDDRRLAHFSQQLLTEARGARRLHLSAAPEDAKRIEHAFADLELTEQELTVSADPSLEAGSLRLETELGTLEAHLDEVLVRLASAAQSASHR